jgi:hypothetical protein
LLAKERQLTDELESSQRRREDIREKIKDYKERQEVMKRLNTLL